MITFHDVRKAAKEIVAANPNTVNPRTEFGGCLYRGPDNTTCLAGAVLLHFDLELPEEHVTILNAPDVEKFTVPAMKWLKELQSNADSGVVTWEKALKQTNSAWNRGVVIK